jgi:hypothetical protein
MTISQCAAPHGLPTCNLSEVGGVEGVASPQRRAARRHCGVNKSVRSPSEKTPFRNRDAAPSARRMDGPVSTAAWPAPSAPPDGRHRQHAAACRGANFCARIRMAHTRTGAGHAGAKVCAPTHRQHIRLAPVHCLPGGDARRAKQPEGLLPSCNPSSNGRRPCRARVGSEKREWHFVDVPPM